MFRYFLLPAIVLSALLSPVTAGGATKRVLTPDDIYSLRSVGSPAVSPDGAWVAYVVTVNDRASDERRFELRMVEVKSATAMTLVAPSASLRSPRFSPDGRYISYIATPPDSKTSQILLLDRRGGEPRVLTHVSGDLGSYAWSPDGKELVAVLEAGEPESASAPAHPQPYVLRDWHFKQDVSGYLSVGHDRHLIRVRVQDGSMTPLTADSSQQEDHPAWSPDGRWIAFTRTHEKGGDRDGANDIALIPAQGGAVRVLTRSPAGNQQGLEFTADSQFLTFRMGAEARYYAYQQDQLMVVPVQGGAPRSATASLDRAVVSAVVAPKGHTAIIAVEDDASVYPASVDLDSGKVQRLVDGARTLTELARGGDVTVSVGGDDMTPNEIYVLETRGPRRLTRETETFLSNIELGPISTLVSKSQDGTEVHSLVTYPPGYVAGRAYPTVLWIHGGPNGQDEHTLDFDAYQFRRQFIAANGYVVIGVNYRGSSGRGFDYARAIYADWGHKEVEDLLGATDAAVKAGIADPDRLAIGGWSYGGILTDYTIASDNRFKAAASGAGSANQFLMYGVDQYVLQYENELGLPWKDPAAWMKVSYPFFHADRIHTPTLFMGGDKDFNVPVSGGEQMYQALRSLGVPTELVVYPDQFHDMTRPSFVKDRMERVRDWFDRYLAPK